MEIIGLIDELQKIILTNEVQFKSHDIEDLRKEVQLIESYNEFYNQEITEDQYGEIMRKS